MEEALRSKRSVIAALAVAFAALPGPSAAATAPGAGSGGGHQLDAEVGPLSVCLFHGHICGNVYNRDDRYNLLITDNWGKYRNRSTWHVLKPGQNGHDVGVKDVDGYWVGPGCKVKRSLGLRTVGPGWHKVRDGQKIQIVDIRC
ncbi:hypothetical protein [Streptomyces sp. NPDC056160]|uniref:hypothetical protein n=1 Tax=Streptomyces sp. NPDC056160 TaxID=3345731 RepID=UPI0035E21E7B